MTSIRRGFASEARSCSASLSRFVRRRNATGWRMRSSAEEDAAFEPYRRPSWVSVPEGFVEPEQHLTYEDEMELFGDEYEDLEDPCGPPGLFLLGFQAHEWPQVRMYVDRVGGQGIKVVPCSQDAMNRKVRDVLDMPEPEWYQPASSNGPSGAPSGATRVIVFSGLVKEDVSTITELLEGSGLPRIIVTVAIKKEMDSMLGEIVSEAILYERQSVGDISACKDLYEDIPRAFLEGDPDADARNRSAETVDAKSEYQRHWEDVEPVWSKYPQKGSETEEMVQAYFSGDMEKGNRLLSKIQTHLIQGEPKKEEDLVDRVAEPEVEVLDFGMLYEDMQDMNPESPEVTIQSTDEEIEQEGLEEPDGTDPSRNPPPARTLKKVELLELCQRLGLNFETEVNKAAKRGISLE